MLLPTDNRTATPVSYTHLDVYKRQGETLVEEMNNYVKQFIIDNNENVLGPSVFMMMCSTCLLYTSGKSTPFLCGK